jgi:leucyl aminopeptidase
MHCAVTSAPLTQLAADWLILPTSEEGYFPLAGDIDRLWGGRLEILRQGKDVNGKTNELVPVLGTEGLAARRVLLLGLGKRAESTRATLYRAASAACRHLCTRHHGRIVLALPTPWGTLSWEDVVLGFSTGFVQALHSPALKQGEASRFTPDEFFLHINPEAPQQLVQDLLRQAQSIGRAVGLARDLVNLPPCDKFPVRLAERCQELGRHFGFQCTILDEPLLQKERMGCLLGVAQGSVQPPRLAVLQYSNGKGEKTLGLVGKGVTFDSGGLSLKTNDQMLDMKCDMAGAATVLAAFTAIAELRLPINALGVLPLVENMPSGTAVKLGDVLHARNGKTVEILNTDAEGRLILADALHYATELKATHLVDLATLTGACMVALGTEVAGLFANNQPWADQVAAAIQRAGERAWQMPMFADYRDLLKSQVADLKNVGGKYAGSITAAKFLEQFVNNVPWVHLDIAGPAFANDESATRDAGGTGCMVRSLVTLAQQFA